MLSIDSILNRVAQTTVDVDIYPDQSAAGEVAALIDEIAAVQDTGIKQVRSIGDQSPVEELIDRLEEIRQGRVTITLRAMSQAEIEVQKRRVVKDHPIPKGLSQDDREQREAEREHIVLTYLIAQSITHVVDYSTGEEADSLTQEDVYKLYTMLSRAEWEELRDAWLRAQGQGAALTTAINDPSFRRDEAVDEGVPVDGAKPEAGATE